MSDPVGNTNTAAASQTSGSTTSKASSFWKGVKAEFRKIIWPTRDELIKQSGAVIAVSIVVGLIIAVIDRIVQYGLNFLLG